MSGTLFIVAAPSGAGKTSLVRELMRADPVLKLSISFTTRAPRTGELNGVHYHFIDVPTFEAKIAADALLEYALVHGNYYGTGKATVDEELARDQDLILEIDWQGARQVRTRFPQTQSIFILPPSIATLEFRLKNRGQDSPEVIQKRVRNAVEEMRHLEEFDFVLINDSFDIALLELQTIFKACRLRSAPQLHRHATLVQKLTAE
jgi:guanylate kinase